MPQFDVFRFEHMIEQRGRNIVWERSRRCPCWDPIMGRQQANCPACNSIGYVYTLQGTFKATVLGVAGQKRYGKMGEWIDGDAQMTFPAALLIAQHDRITLPDAVYRESAIFVKASRETFAEPASALLSIIECADQTRTYQLGRDFDLVGSSISWKGQQPPAGAAYSLLYTAKPVFVVWTDIPKVRTQVTHVGADGLDVVKEMPRHVQLRRWLDWRRPGT